MAHAPSVLRVAVLTGTDSESTRDCVCRLMGASHVEIAGVIYDRGVTPLKTRLRRAWKRARMEGIAAYTLGRLFQLAGDVFASVAGSRFDAGPVRRAVFPGETRSLAELSERRSIPYIIVDSLNSAAAQAQLRSLRADLGVVLGTRILKAATFSIPRLGSINVHKGKVPHYRGQPPAFWELYHGEPEAGVTIHFVVDRLDAGPVVAADTVPIGIHETEHSLRQKLDRLATRLLLEAVNSLAEGHTIPQPQADALGRLFTTPTRRQRLELQRRLGTRPASLVKRVVKTALYATLLYAGPVAVRNFWLRLRGCTRYTVLLYHRTNDFSKDHLTVSIDRFIEQLDVLRRLYPILSLKEALDAAKARRFLGPNAVVITFDDGYADNAELAAPILKYFGLPATFFVSAGIVEAGWQFPHDDTSPYRFETLRWEQVLAMRDLGFEVGSHGLSHANLAKCSTEEARRELRGSRELLESRLGTAVRAFAYPFGGQGDITSEARREAVIAGFDVVAAAFGGSNVGTIDCHNVLRTSINDEVDPLTLRAAVEGVHLAALRRCVSRAGGDARSYVLHGRRTWQGI